MAIKESKAQLEVWAWKERAQASLEHLPAMQDKLALIHERTRELVAELRKSHRSTPPNEATPPSS